MGTYDFTKQGEDEVEEFNKLGDEIPLPEAQAAVKIKAKVFSIPAINIFDALKLQGLLPSGAKYLGCHSNAVENVFMVKVCDESYQSIEEGTVMPKELVGLLPDSENVVKFHVL